MRLLYQNLIELVTSQFPASEREFVSSKFDCIILPPYGTRVPTGCSHSGLLRWFFENFILKQK